MSGARRRNIYRVAFAHRDFRWLMAAAVQSRTGDFLYGVAIIVVVYERTGSGAWVGATAVLSRIPLIVLPPLAGALADRVSRRDLMIVLDLARGANMVGLAVVTATEAPVALLVALAVVSGALSTPYSPANIALLPRLMPERDLAAANAVYGALESLALVVGPAIGGALVAAGDPTVAFVINAATFGLSALCLLRVQRDPRPERGTSEQRESRVLAGIRALTSNSAVIIVVLGLVTACLVVGGTTVIYILVSVEKLGLGGDGYGYLLAAAGAGGVLGSLLGDRVAESGRLAVVVATSLVAVGGGTAVLAWIEEPVLALVATVVFGTAYILLEVLAVTLMQRYVEARVLGQASGTLDAAAFGAILLGAAIVGPLDSAFGLVAAVLVPSVPAVAAGVLTLAWVRRLDRRAADQLSTIAPRLEAFRHVAPLTGAAQPALERLAAEAVEEQLPADALVVRQGEPATDFFVVLHGRLDVSSSGGRAARPSFIRTLSEGDAFGEIGLLEQRPRTATVRTTTDTTLLRIPGRTFVEVVTDVPDLTDPFREIVASRLARTHGPAPGG